MELYKIGLPDEEAVIVKDTFIVDQIFPLCIRKMNDHTYTVLFLANQDSTESSIFLQTALSSSSDNDEKYLDSHPLNINNITKSEDKLKFYIEATKDASNDSLYVTGFNMVEEEHKPYFKTIGAKSLDEVHAALLDLFITRDNFIKISLFFTRLIRYDPNADLVFINHKFHHMKYSTINHIKLDGSATDISSRVVCNHYTCGNGPELYKFNFISPKIPGRKLRNPMNPEAYNQFYSEDFILTDMIYEPSRDYLYVIYEVRSDITDKYKETKILRFDKEFYNRSNLIDIGKIYEEEN